MREAGEHDIEHAFARAGDAAGDERERLWSLMTGLWPNFDVYQSRTQRRIPVVVLEPAE